MNYKVGDKVKIVDNIKRLKVCPTCGVGTVPEMYSYAGKEAEIIGMSTDKPFIRLNVDSGAWNWCEHILEAIISTVEASNPPKKAPQDREFKDSFTYGGIKIAKIKSTDNLVPTKALKITLPPDDRKALAIAINKNLSCLLIGETGTGKTSIVKELAFKRSQPYVRINMTGFTTPDELIGTKSVKNGATYFEHGIITNAMQRGAMLVIDEVNATTPDCLFILHGLLDEDRRITLPNGEIITPHENFRVFATCNPDYEGTKSMNKAFIDRFPIILLIDTLAPKAEQKLLIDRTDIDNKLAEQLVVIATMARKDYVENKLSVFISTRSLLSVANLIKNDLTPRKAYETAVVQKTSNKDEQKVLLDFFLSVFKLAQGSEDNYIVVQQSELTRLHDEVAVAERETNTAQKENSKLLDDYAELQRKCELLLTPTKPKEEIKPK